MQVVHAAAEVKSSLQALLPSAGRSMLFLRKLKCLVLMHLSEATSPSFLGQVIESSFLFLLSTSPGEDFCTYYVLLHVLHGLI